MTEGKGPSNERPGSDPTKQLGIGLLISDQRGQPFPFGWQEPVTPNLIPVTREQIHQGLLHGMLGAPPEIVVPVRATNRFGDWY